MVIMPQSIGVCLKIVYLIFQWSITMFPIQIAIGGYPLFSDKPINHRHYHHMITCQGSKPCCILWRATLVARWPRWSSPAQPCGKALAAPWWDFGGVFMCFLEANHGIESLFASRNSWDVMMCFNMFLLDLTWFYGVLL